MSAVLVFFPGPRLPGRMLSLVHSLCLWAERHPAPVSSAKAAAPRTPAPLSAPVPAPLSAPVTKARAPSRKAASPVVFTSAVSPGCPATTEAVVRQRVAPAAMSVAESLEERLDKDFERELGFSPDTTASASRGPPTSRRTVYLPPEPGVAPRESLSTSDIVQAVLEHKQAVLACIHKYAPRTRGSEPERLVMSWRVLPGGTVTDVAVEDEALQGTPFAGCMAEQVRTWTFPRHRVPGREPIRFPFVY